jgi:predicted NBD/HSP70 family sugar kinase
MNDQIQKRANNSFKLLKSLHSKGPMRRLELAKQLEIRPNSVGNIANDLLNNNWIEFTNPDQPRSKIQLSQEGALSLAISTDGDNVKMANINLYGQLSQLEVVCHSNIQPEDFIRIIVPKIKNRIESTSHSYLGLGISLSGIVNSDTGTVIRSINFGPWAQFPLRQKLKEHLKLPILIDNDMRCLAWSHAWFDHLSDQYSTSLFIGLGRGVSCSTLAQGKINRGAHFLAGEIGHLHSGHEKRPCICGKTDCLETYIGMDALMKTANQVLQPSQPICDEKDLLNNLTESQKSTHFLSNMAEHLSRILGPILVANDPQALILCSEEKGFTQTLIPQLLEQLQHNLQGVDINNLEVLAFGNRQENELRGAAALVIEHAFKHETIHNYAETSEKV